MRTAWAKGLGERNVVIKHALRNAVIPVLTLLGTQLPLILGGTVVIETIFAWPGVGAYAFDSIIALDYAPVMGVTLLVTAVFVFVNFCIDLLYPVVDPRIRLWGQTS